jgi:hypothetical protein
MRNVLQPSRGAGALAHAVTCAALVGLVVVWLASAGCDGSPVAERAGEDLTHETEAARDDAGEGGAESDLPQGAASESGDAPVASDVAPAAYDEPATSASGLDPSSEGSQPTEPAGESAVDSATETGGSELGNN